MIKYRTKMSLDYFNDFYFIEALKANIAMKIAENNAFEFKRSVEKLSNDIAIYEERLMPNIAKRAFVYIWAACLGEARHAVKEMAESHYIKGLEGASRGEVFMDSANYPPSSENVKKLIAVFAQTWRSSFGGKKWHEIAKALEMYFKVPPSTFIDHVVDLQHNNGTVFSKEESGDTIGFKISYDGNFPKFLEYKFKKNILKSSILDELRITVKTWLLLKRYCTIFEQKPITWVKPKLDTLDEYVVEWGDKNIDLVKKWQDWADCSKGNRPNAKIALYQAGLFDCSVWNYTVEEFKDFCNSCVKKVNDRLQGLGYDMLTEIKPIADEYFNREQNNCKVKKLDKTYTIVPVKVKTFYKGSMKFIKIQVPLNFFGHGKETDYGFEIEELSQGISQTGDEKGFDGDTGFSDCLMKLGSSGIKIHAGEQKWHWNDKKLEAILE